MTLEEKISQMAHGAAAIPRLDIPAYNFWNEALHGVGRNGRATVFPQAIGMAATWNPQLVQQIASAIADEGRAKYHETLRRKGDTLIYQGLTFWSPIDWIGVTSAAVPQMKTSCVFASSSGLI